MSKLAEGLATDVQTVVWDLDGTLLDSFGIYRDCLNEVLRTRGIPEVPEPILRLNHHGFIEDSVANALRTAGYNVTEAELAAIMRDFYVLDNAYIDDADHHLFSDAVDLVERVHQAGIRQVVATNRPHGVDRGNGSPRNLVQHSRLGSMVDGVLCGDDCAYRKPRREFLEARFGKDLATLGKIVVIGDQYVDAEFADNIGGTAILVNRTGTIAHLDKLGDRQASARIVASLHDVHIAG